MGLVGGVDAKQASARASGGFLGHFRDGRAESGGIPVENWWNRQIDRIAGKPVSTNDSAFGGGQGSQKLAAFVDLGRIGVTR